MKTLTGCGASVDNHMMIGEQCLGYLTMLNDTFGHTSLTFGGHSL